MKLLMTTDAVGGVWTYSLDLRRALAADGVDIVLATMGPPPSDDQRKDARRLPNITLRESTFALEWMNDCWPDVAAAGSWLLDLEDEFRPDVVHLNGYAHANLPWSAPVVVVGHSCVLSWWQAVKREAAPAAQYRPYRAAVRNGLRAADVVVAPSVAMLEALERHYGPLPGDTRVIANGRDRAMFVPREKQPFVMTAGRLWDEAKNVAAIEAVAPRIDWAVYIAGEQSSNGDAGAQQLDGVRRLGRLSASQVAEHLGRASIYALPARY